MPERRLPSTAKLIEKRNEGMTLREITEWVEKTTGQKVSSSSVSVNLSRASETGERRGRYTDVIPWVVKVTHAHDKRAQYLRFLGRRRRGLALSRRHAQALDSWLTAMKDAGAVVTYMHDGPYEGWQDTEGEGVYDPTDHDPVGWIPIEVLPGQPLS